MHHLLESRPEGFPSQERAVEWQQVSPDHLCSDMTDLLMSSNFSVTGNTGSTIRNIYSARLSVPSLIVPSTPEEVAAGKPAWKWRTPLKSTSPYWQGWSGNYVIEIK